MKFPKYLQGYFIIFLLTIVYSLLSIFYELNYESEKRPLKEENLFQMMFLRFIHSFVVIYIYVSVFIFYRSENIHYIIYLSVLILIVLHWILFECCVLTYLEWSVYDIDIDTVPNTNNPVHNITNAFREKTGFKTRSDFLLFAFIIYSLYRVNLPLYVKCVYFIVFSYFVLIIPFNRPFKPITIENVMSRVQEHFSLQNFKNKVLSLEFIGNLKDKDVVEGFI